MADFGVIEDENESAALPEKESAYQKYVPEPVKNAVGGIESAGRMLWNAPAGFIAGGLGHLTGVIGGDPDQGAERGEEAARNVTIPPLTKQGGEVDEALGEGYDWAKRDVYAESLIKSDREEYKVLTGKDMPAKMEQARRSTYEAQFDALAFGGLAKSAIKRVLEKPKAKPTPEPAIAKGPEGAQQEFGFVEEGAQGENATPNEMMGQKNQSPYNLPKSDVDRLNEELNPSTEERMNEQGELFTDYNPVDKFKLEESQGGGRFKTPDMGNQVTSALHTPEDKGLGGATEQSNFSADLYGPKPEKSVKPLPWRGPKSQRGVVDPDLLTLGVSKILDSEGFKKTMEKFRGTFSPGAIRESIRDSENPDSKQTIVFMPPDQFLHLAEKRYDPTGSMAEYRRESIRKGLTTEHGLNEIPQLYMSQEAEGHSIWGHEGRHRADVFKEQGLDLMPVRVIHNSLTWGKAAKIGKLPSEVVSENGIRTEFPHPENWKPEKDLDFTQPEKHKIIDTQTGKTVGEYNNLSRVRTEADKKNLEYGAHRYRVERAHPLGGVGKKQGGAVSFKSETENVKAAQEGDTKAFESLFKDNYNRLLKLAKRVVKDEDVAKDVVQDTMISAHEHLNEFEGKSKFSTWLFRIAINKAKNQLQSHNLKGGVELSEEQRERFEPRHEDTPENILQGKQRAEGINAGWDRLDEDQKLILEMREIEGLDYQKIADLLQIPMGSVKSRIARAREDLAKNISSRGLGQTNIGKSQRGSIGWFDKEVDKSVDKKGLVGTLMDARKQFELMKGTLKENLGDLKPEGIEDIGAGFKIATNALIDRSASILAQNKGPVGKIIKWTVDQLTDIDRKSGLNAESDLYGEKYEPGKGNIFRPLEKRVHGEEGALTLWKDLSSSKEGRAELSEMKEKAIANIGTRLGRYDFKTDRQFRVYEALQNRFEMKRQELNEARAKANIKNIDRLDGYMPAQWDGDYRVTVYDGLGNKKETFGFTNTYTANKAAKALKEKHPDMDVREPQHVDIDKTKLGDLSAFEEAIRAFGADDPVSKALQKTMVELRSSKGFGRHGLQRKGVLGYMGMESGDVGVRNMEKSIEQWFKQADRYISNLEKANVQAQLDSLDLKIREKIPRALKYLNDYIDNSRGASIDRAQLVQDIAGAISRFEIPYVKPGFGESAPRNLLQNFSGTASLYFLTTPRFAISQMLQHQNAIPKYIQMLHEGTIKAPLGEWTKYIPVLGKLANAEFLAYKGFEQFVKPDQLGMDGANWAQRRGHLDSALVAMLDTRFGDRPSEWAKLVKNGVSASFGKLEKNMVRLPVFFSFEYGLRDSIPNAEKRYEVAANATGHYMVNYDQTSRPLMYSKMGLIGDAVKTFKQYSHNAWGQFFEYIDYARQKGGNVEPLISHVGLQTAIGGLKGTVLVGEFTAAIAVLNMILPDDKQIPSPIDLLMNSNLHDILVFGGVSHVLGADISSSVNAPNLPQMFSAPSLEFTGKAVKEAWTYLTKKLNGTATKDDEYQAALALSPAAMHGLVEELYTEPGQPVPRPGQKMKGNIVRTPEEKLKASLLSVKSPREARANAVISAAKRELAQDMRAKTSELDAIVDQVASGKGIDSDLIQRYAKRGGDVSKLSDAVVKRLQERHMDYATRQIYNKKMTPAQIHKLEIIKNALDKSHQPQQGQFGTVEEE